MKISLSGLLNAIDGVSSNEGRILIMTTEELQTLSQTFADSLPENRLSLVAIQGFLLSSKRNPQVAAEKAKDWAGEALKETKDM